LFTFALAGDWRRLDEAARYRRMERCQQLG
jgi:hypothetical protein